MAHDLLNEEELVLAKHLEVLLSDNIYDAASLVEDIVPIFHEGNRTLQPDPIYRPLMYLVNYADHLRFKDLTRIYIENACSVCHPAISTRSVLRRRLEASRSLLDSVSSS